MSSDMTKSGFVNVVTAYELMQLYRNTWWKYEPNQMHGEVTIGAGHT